MPEQALSDRAIFAARPTIHVNGDVNPRVASLLVGLELDEQEDGLSNLELRLTNVVSEPGQEPGFAFEDERAIKLGDQLVVYAGEETAPREIFRGTASALEACFAEDASPTLVVLAEDALQTARLQRRTKTWEHCTVGTVARQVAQSAGLTPKINGLSDDLGTQIQLNESDLAFLRRLLARVNGDVQAVGTELHVAPRSEVQRGTLTLRLHSQLRRATVLADLAHQVTEVTATGWDSAQGRRIVGRCRSAPRGPGQGRTGSELLPRALRERPHQLGHLAVETEAEARVMTETILFDRQRRFVTLHGTADGNPAVRVGAHLTIEGLGPRFSNAYYVTQCRHRYDLNRGYETDFTGESAFFGSP